MGIQWLKGLHLAAHKLAPDLITTDGTSEQEKHFIKEPPYTENNEQNKLFFVVAWALASRNY